MKRGLILLIVFLGTVAYAQNPNAAELWERLSGMEQFMTAIGISQGMETAYCVLDEIDDIRSEFEGRDGIQYTIDEIQDFLVQFIWHDKGILSLEQDLIARISIFYLKEENANEPLSAAALDVAITRFLYDDLNPDHQE